MQKYRRDTPSPQDLRAFQTDRLVAAAAAADSPAAGTVWTKEDTLMDELLAEARCVMTLLSCVVLCCVVCVCVCYYVASAAWLFAYGVSGS